MNAALIVRSSTESATRVTDTRASTLPADEPSVPASTPRRETAAEAAERVGLVLPSPRHRWWAVPVASLAAVILVAIAVVSVLPSELVAEKENPRVGVEQGTPYARTPASAQPVKDRITFGELGDVARQYEPDGDIYFVTVTEPTQSVLSWLVGRDEPAIQFLTEEEKFGVQTPEQRRSLALVSMRTSEQVAQFVALERVGYDVELLPGEVVIQEMICLVVNEEGTECEQWSPSDEVLDPGDRIQTVGGEAIDGVEDLSRILEDYEPGDVVEMTIVRRIGDRDETLDVEVELTAAPDDPDRTLVGFYPFDTRRVELPFELDIDTGRIGGPSAGLAFTLTLIDELTEGELTGGGRVAVTGTIQLNGTVGAIGGLRQKASAVAQTGVDVFIVPAAQGEDDIAAAREAAGDEVTIIPVETLDEALAVLADLGGDPIPPGGECAPDLGTC
jgi:PDZ domain-containing protein